MAGRSVLTVASLATTLPLVLFGALALVFLLVAIGAAVIHIRGSEPTAIAAWRHAWREAAYRAGGVWGEFADWIRRR